MSYRVKLVIVNTLAVPIQCSELKGAEWDNLAKDQVVYPGQTLTFTNDDNNRLYITWTDANGVKYQMGMTCPVMSNNSACGYMGASLGNPGLQKYAPDGHPVTFTYRIGTPTLASWKSPSGPPNQSDNPDYGDM